MNYQIRPAKLSDAQQVADILLSSRAEFLPYARSPQTDAENRAWVQNVLLATGGVNLAYRVDANLNEQVLGVLAVSQQDGIAWIDQLYLAPHAVGQGIGSFLLAHALQTLPRPIHLYIFQPRNGD